MKKLLFIALSLLVIQASAQKRKSGIYRAKYEKLVDLTGHVKLSGWFFAPGLTYSLTRFNNKEEELYRSNDTVYNVTFDPGGRIGLYLEVGRYKIFKYPRLFHYMDYSLAFKQVKGKESFTGTVVAENSQTTLMTLDGKGKFSYNYLLANFNLNNVWQIGNYSFIQNSIGANADYSIINRSAYDGDLSYQTQQTPSRFLLQLHYKLGFGYKLNNKWFIIPSVETPILSLVSFDNFKSTTPTFSSRYRPIIFSIRFAWLNKPKSGDCPKVDGAVDDTKRQQNYQMNK